MKDIFSDLYKKVMSFFNNEAKEENSKKTACNRLKLVLMQDRAKMEPALMEKMRKEMIEVISRYVEIDKDALDLNIEAEGDSFALMLNIPVLRAKTREEIEAREGIIIKDEDEDEDNDNEDDNNTDDAKEESENKVDEKVKDNKNSVVEEVSDKDKSPETEDKNVEKTEKTEKIEKTEKVEKSETETVNEKTVENSVKKEDENIQSKENSSPNESTFTQAIQKKKKIKIQKDDDL